MSSKVFFDTNIIAYVFDRGNPAKREQARGVVASRMRSGAMVLSTQVLQELFAVFSQRIFKTVS